MAVGDAHVFTGFLTPVLTQLSFQSHQLLFSHTSAEVRGENTPERKFASTGSQTPNHESDMLTTESSGQVEKEENAENQHFLLFPVSSKWFFLKGLKSHQS